jgi:D-xylose transport system substrate-binding protein
MIKPFSQKTNFIVWLLLSPFLVITINSCENKSEIKIGMMLPNTIKERYPRERDYFIAKINELGGTVISTDAQNDDKLQLRQAEELINSGIDVLVIIAVNKNTAANIVRHAHIKGIKVIAYERIITNCNLDYYISFNNVKVGELLANYAFQKKPSGNYIILGGDKGDQNAIWVHKGQLNILQTPSTSGKIKIAYDIFIEDWSEENAYHEITRFLNLSGIVPDAIIASSDAMSLGAIRALEENNISGDQFPVITGQNAELKACKNIVKGKQTMTIYKPLKTEAEVAAELAMKIAKNEKIDNIQNKSFNGKTDVPSILLEPILVDAANLKSVIIESGFQKEADVYSE